jgi:hypothetical protein
VPGKPTSGMVRDASQSPQRITDGMSSRPQKAGAIRM